MTVRSFFDRQELGFACPCPTSIQRLGIHWYEPSVVSEYAVSFSTSCVRCCLNFSFEMAYIILHFQWSVGTVLMGLYSFMLEETPTYGSISTSDAFKRKCARESLEFNVQNK